MVFFRGLKGGDGEGKSGLVDDDSHDSLFKGTLSRSGIVKTSFPINYWYLSPLRTVRGMSTLWPSMNRALMTHCRMKIDFVVLGASPSIYSIGFAPRFVLPKTTFSVIWDDYIHEALSFPGLSRISVKSLGSTFR